MKKITIYVLSNMLLGLIGSPHKGVSHTNQIAALGYLSRTITL